MAQPASSPPVPVADDTITSMLEAVAAARSRTGTDEQRLPQRLSPSRAADFARCPKLFYYKSIVGIPTPNTIATTRGTLAHTAFERIFDTPAGERTPDLAVSYLAPAWAALTDLEPDLAQYPLGSPERERALDAARGYLDVAPPGSAEELDLLTQAQNIVRSWFLMERVNNFSPNALELPDGQVIDGREFHAAADSLGFTLHGFIDRLDRWTSPSGEVIWSISDYKGGKVPGAGKKYSNATMERIGSEAFFQLRVYAVLMYEMFGIEVKYLRLVYVATGDRDGGIKTLTMTSALRASTVGEVKAIWRSILRSARTSTWQTNLGPLCQWCHFRDICPAVNPEMDGLAVAG